MKDDNTKSQVGLRNYPGGQIAEAVGSSLGVFTGAALYLLPQLIRENPGSVSNVSFTDIFVITISVTIPAVIMSYAFLFLNKYRVRNKRKKTGLCPACGYRVDDLGGRIDVCPECAMALDQ